MKRKNSPFFFKLIVALLIGNIGLTTPAGAARKTPSLNSNTVTHSPQVSLQTEPPFQEDGVRISYHSGTGKVRFIGTDPGKPIRQPAVLSLNSTQVDAARGFLSTYGALFGLSDPDQELVVKKETSVEKGRSFTRFQQVFQGIPVFGGELIIQTDGRNDVLSASGEILPDLSLDITPAIDPSDASQAALDAVSKWYATAALQATQPELWIYNPVLVQPGSGGTRLVWRLEVTSTDLLPIRELVLVDAQRGSIVLHFNQIETAKSRKVYDNQNNAAWGLPGPNLIRTEGQAATGNADVDSAYDFAGDTYDFYLNYHSRDSLDGLGMELVSTVRYCDPIYPCPFENAFWNGSQMVYGQGFASADDVVGHEMTHGVTNHESSLFYYYQSGAINESFSDLWGELIDLTNGKGNDAPGVRWLIGEDVPGGAIRDMSNPPAFSDPDSMTSGNYYTGSDDNGGVHWNSGINNKAVYLLTDGGAFNGQTVSALGITKVAKIYYEVQTSLLTSGADYADLYDALYQGCLNLIGSDGIANEDCNQVRAATNAVEMDRQPIADFNTDAPLCPAGQELGSTLFLDDMESYSGSWLTNNTNRWHYTQGFSHSGLWSLYGDDYPAAISDSYLELNTDVTLQANSYLHFSHAYAFDPPNYDGGVLEYSTNGGSSWVDAGSLIDINGYDGSIASGYGNPLANRSAFLDESHGYISSRLSLAPFTGQSIRFRWRMGLDSTVYYLGWLIDDVRIYTCGGFPGAFDKSSPSDGAVGQPTNPTLTWNGSSGATSYEYCTSPSAACSGSWTGVGSNTSVGLNGLTSGATYYWQVRARNVSGTTEANSGTWWRFTVLPSPPTITGFSPLSGPVNTSVTITGTNFTGATAVRFNGIDASFTVDSSTSIHATVPSNATNGKISVVTPGGTASSSSDFIVVPEVKFGAQTYPVAENAGTAAVLVTLSAPSSQIVTVAYATSAGTAVAGEDYIESSGSLTFHPGETSKTFSISITDDSLDEVDETINLVLSAPTDAVLGTPTSAILTIEDDDQPPDVQLTAASYWVSESTEAAVLTATLSAPSGKTVTVDYAAGNGTAVAEKDYTAASGTLSFLPGVITQTFTIPITNDILDELDETLSIYLSAPVNTTLGTLNEATLTINDDDPAPNVSFEADSLRVSEGDGTANIRVALSAASSLPITITFTTVDGTASSGSDYGAANGSIAFAPGVTKNHIEITILADAIKEEDETFTLRLSNPVNVNLVEPGEVTCTIVDDDLSVREIYIPVVLK